MIGKIPLWAKDHSVVAWATVDEEDFYAAYGHRWRWHSGYATRAIWVRGGKGRQITVFLHREILGLPVGSSAVVDHINRDRLDNRRENLRLVSGPQNAQNVTKRAGTSSSYRGVHWHAKAGKWVAGVYVGGEYNYLGLFVDEHDAGEAARLFRLEHLSHAVD